MPGIYLERNGLTMRPRADSKRRADFFWYFWTPVSDVLSTEPSTNAMETIVHEPRSGEPIFFATFEPP